ncbi:outer membrane protein assembly factor BamB [Marinomonas epiphytica]
MSKSLLVVALSSLLLLQGCSNALPKPDAIDTQVVLDTDWRIGVDGYYGKKGERLNLLAQEQTLYFITDLGTIYQVDQEDGRKESIVYTGFSPSTGVTRNQDTFYFGTHDAEVAAVSTATETVLWQRPMSSEILSEVAYAAGKLAVQTADGWLSVLDAQTGNTLWRVKEDLPALTVRGTSVPVIAQGRVIAGTALGELKAYDLNTGNELWSFEVGKPEGRYEIERLSDVDGRVVVQGGIVYAVAYNGTLSALSLESGRPIWQRAVSSASGVALQGDILAVTDVSSKVLAFNAKNGNQIWENDTLVDRDLQLPIFVGEYVALVDRGGYIHLLNLATGEVEGRRILDEDVLLGGRMVSNGQQLFAMTPTANLVAFRYRK